MGLWYLLMAIEISDETEAASRAGSPEQNSELPAWHLGGVSAFHRRDIYNDAC
jgi:hypothetical protein